MGKFEEIIKKAYFVLPLALTLSTANADALQIVYPKSPNVEISAASTFFIGNTEPGSVLKINDKEVKVFENGSFVEVIALEEGFNRITIESVNTKECDDGCETVKEEQTYIIKKTKKTDPTQQDSELIEFPKGEFLYAAVAKPNTPLRSQANENAKRLTHLEPDTILMINGKQGDYYRVSLTKEENAWVRADFVVTYSTINEKMLTSATNVNLSEDDLYNYIKTDLTFPAPYRVVETENGLTFEVFNIKDNAADSTIFTPTETIKGLVVNTVSTENKSTYFIEMNHRLWGYHAYYDKDTLVLKIRKAPTVNAEKPLKNIKIAIDAGHGGDDAGAIGPTGVKEKDINLDISKKLRKELESAGADVVMTRTKDTDVELYKRAKIARESDALISVSIHANALPDGGDPYTKHGTSVFYYNQQAKELANTVKNTLTQELGTKDDGVCKCSFVLTRPTMPLSVLVEVAYMIHPEEYSLLLDESFREKAAIAIKNAIFNYLKEAEKTPIINNEN